MNKSTMQVLETCKNYGYETKELQDVIFITTPKSKWWIDCCDENNIKLYHKNMRISRTQTEKFGKDYHLQKTHIKNVNDAISYIKKHDNAKYSKNENSKEARHYRKMERLFRKIEAIK